MPEGLVLLCSRPTVTGVPDKKCVNLCPMSVCLSDVRCNAPRMTTIAGFLQDYNSILVYFCVFHRSLRWGFIKLVFVCVENVTHVTISDLGDCRICARLHDLSEIVEHNNPSGHLALQDLV